MDVDELRSLQAALGDCLFAADPVAALSTSVRRLGLPAANLARIDLDGLRLAALLIAKLRFARLRNGSPRAVRWFARDPAGCSAAFRDYHQSVVPADDPWREAELFEGWLANRVD